MNYETASDFDLSMAVAKLANPSNKDIQDWDGEVAIASGGDGRGGYWVTYFDINNPADMWPIITSNNLSVISAGEGKGYYASNGYLHHSGSIFDDTVEHHDKNPLRAAAIVYLKMMEQK